mmetsp:Transcript_12909/g.33629  ORF Transcript_12909/g.33629 Transcript_12909/m.33629 type:complete len:236 (-) Transcript_12909:262-969(-)
MSVLTNVRHCAVGRLSDKVVVASYVHCNQGGMPAHFHAVVDKVLRSSKLAEHPRLTITDKEVGTLHYVTDAQSIYIIITAPDYPQRTAFRFLDELKTRFSEQFSDAVDGSAENGLTARAKRTMLELCTHYDDTARVDKTIAVIHQVEEVQNIMHDNIGQILATHENLEVLEDKTDALRSEAQTFQRQAVDLKRVMWFRNVKLRLIIGMVILCIVGYIVTPIIIRAVAAANADSRR